MAIRPRLLGVRRESRTGDALVSLDVPLRRADAHVIGERRRVAVTAVPELRVVAAHEILVERLGVFAAREALRDVAASQNRDESGV